MSQQNVIESIKRSCATRAIAKMTMLLSAQGLQSKPPKKGTNPNHANKGVKVEHGGNRLITGQ